MASSRDCYTSANSTGVWIRFLMVLMFLMAGALLLKRKDDILSNAKIRASSHSLEFASFLQDEQPYKDIIETVHAGRGESDIFYHCRTRNSGIITSSVSCDRD